MSANHKQKKAIYQNVSQMASDIYETIKVKVNALPIKSRLIIAWRILRGK